MRSSHVSLADMWMASLSSKSNWPWASLSHSFINSLVPRPCTERTLSSTSPRSVELLWSLCKDARAVFFVLYLSKGGMFTCRSPVSGGLLLGFLKCRLNGAGRFCC